MPRVTLLPVDDIQDWLGAHPGIHDVTQLSLAIGYRQFYGLDFYVDEHRMGRVPVHAERIFVQLYRRFASHRGTVFLLHGYLDHSGLQGPTVERLLDLGYDVVVIDHAGHGFSTGDRAGTDTFQLYVDSVSAAEEAIETKGSRVIMGHSLGGAVAMTHMLQHPHVFRRAVLIAPLYRPKSWRLLKLVHLLGRRFMKGQRRLWRQNTRDETFRHFIKYIDPLSPRFIPITWINAMMDWISHFQVLDPVDADVLVVQGTDDGTVDWRGNLPVIRQKFPSARIDVVPAGKHHLLNEIDEWRERVWTHIEPFLLQVESTSEVNA